MSSLVLLNSDGFNERDKMIKFSGEFIISRPNHTKQDNHDAFITVHGRDSGLFRPRAHVSNARSM